MTFPVRESAIPSEVGKYQLVAELARGGMGNVYLVVVHGPGGFSKLLAMKELKPELSDDETYVSMFLDEARLAARLTHPNIVQTNEVGSEGSHHYMTMEFLDGRSLHRIRRRFGDQNHFPIGAHLRVISESLLGLHYAHELLGFDGEPLGIVHRDVSPLNLFVTFDGQAKVLDFGIAKAIDSSLETKAGVLKGRVAYMAPEQACGAKADRRADIYSAGVMIWEAAAGRRLWPGMSEVEILSRLLREGAPSLHAVCPDAPDELNAICARAMARHFEDRYSTAAELHSDLETHIAQRDDVMSMREIGLIVGRTFSDERRKMNAVIEGALARARGTPRSGVMPVMPLLHGGVSGTPSGPGAAGEDSGNLSLRPQNTPLSSQFLVTSEMPPPSPTSVSRQDASNNAPSGWWSKRLAALTLCGSAAFAVLAAFAAVQHNGMPVQLTTARAAPDRAPIVGPGVTPELVDVAIRVAPSSAQITIDGASVANNPFHARYPRDHQIHHIAATAEGYDPKLEDVTFSGDVSVDVSLDRRAYAPPRRAVPPPAVVFHATRPAFTPVVPNTAPPVERSTPPPQGSVTDINPAGGRAPLRPIATSNPYGNQ